MRSTRSRNAPYQHTSCPYCGELVFDRILRRCKRCGGQQVVYLAERDLTFLGRRRPRPLKPPLKDD